MKIYYDANADLGVLKGKKVAIIGFGSQGHAQALNLRDSGVDVVVSEMPGTPNYEAALKYGFQPVSASDAAQQAQVVQILTQDHVQARLYESDLKPHMKRGQDALMFSHGFNIHYGQIVPPKHVDVVMIAPKGPGALVRARIRQGCRGALAGRHLPGCHRQRHGHCAGLRQGHRRHAGRGASRPPSRKRPRPTCSASRPCCAAASPN